MNTDIKEKRMIKKSCENPQTHYICLFGIRLVFCGRHYMGWYRP